MELIKQTFTINKGVENVEYEDDEIHAILLALLEIKGIVPYKSSLCSYDQVNIGDSQGNKKEKFDLTTNIDRNGKLQPRELNPVIFEFNNKVSVNIYPTTLLQNVNITDSSSQRFFDIERKLIEGKFELENFIHENQNHESKDVIFTIPINNVNYHWLEVEIAISGESKICSVYDSMVQKDYSIENDNSFKEFRGVIEKIFPGINYPSCSSKNIQRDNYYGGAVRRMRDGTIFNSDPYNWNGLDYNYNITSDYEYSLQARQSDLDLLLGSRSQEKVGKKLMERYVILQDKVLRNSLDKENKKLENHIQNNKEDNNKFLNKKKKRSEKFETGENNLLYKAFEKRVKFENSNKSVQLGVEVRRIDPDKLGQLESLAQNKIDYLLKFAKAEEDDDSDYFPEEESESDSDDIEIISELDKERPRTKIQNNTEKSSIAELTTYDELAILFTDYLQTNNLKSVLSMLRTKKHLTTFRGNFYDNLKIIRLAEKLGILKSITGMQSGKGMIAEEDFNKLIELCSNQGVLDKELLKSITGMQTSKGMIAEEDFKELIKLCSNQEGLDKELLKSITGMQTSKGMIAEKDFNKLIKLCSNQGVLDKELLKSITGMQNGKGMIAEEDAESSNIPNNNVKKTTATTLKPLDSIRTKR